MAAPGKSSRWGSFLSQAVAGVESRLDNILAEAEEQPQQKPTQAAPASSPKPAAQLAAPAKPAPGSSRSSSTNRTNDRLQARLAKAMAGKNAPGGADGKGTPSPRSSVDASSRPSMERPSTDKEQQGQTDMPPADTPVADSSPADAPPEIIEPQDQPSDDVNVEGRQTPDQDDSADNAAVTSASASDGNANGEALEQSSRGPVTKAVLSDLAKDMEEIKQRQQEEIQEYIERVDSLQAKLQYLSKNAADTAKKAAGSAPSGSMERKLAEKDKKIALLMEEGGKLSSAEQKFRMTIKKLRQQMAEHEKQTEEVKKARDKATSDADTLRKRLDGAEGSEKQQEETKRATAALQKEIDALKKERAKKDEAYRRLEQDSKTKAEQAEAASTETLSKALTAERAKQKELEDANAALRAEKEALTDKARLESIEWTEKLERAAQRSGKVEEELRTELRSMESKLEAMRTAAEEASSGSGGEAQVKMFRQIETLQSQYASARENWQGIESSLLAKAATLEKEREEAQRRESEMRKKARDAASRNRSLEDEVSDLQPALAAARQELESCRDQVTELKALSKKAHEALEQTRADLDKARQRSVSQDDTGDAERRQWVDDVAGATLHRGHQSRPESPLLSVSRTFSSELLGGLPMLGKPRRTPTSGSNPDSPAEGMSPMRRLSGQPPLRPAVPSTIGSGPPPAPFSPFEPPPSDAPQAPSPPTADRENGADEVAPSSPRNIAQDMISVSTVAAGPSVQLVERMSAAIRRLEAEKVAAKEEMARICNQRDEARSDMVSLMKELEEAKDAAKTVPRLEEQVSQLDSRYQTTLEMLGEKSELVEELRADVQDVKAMYRELVERTVQ
ncbi:m protein repeat protein [Purpureocillium lavendulum]|uniref:M protein repeat protein n=1 Tax=Purpureocillium lavendulum TaxID=1247861 RepID=A0AB34G3R0_9HYPO|nr:m protein repeat protein [Purpureocillium lavendulum]